MLHAVAFTLLIWHFNTHMTYTIVLAFATNLVFGSLLISFCELMCLAPPHLLQHVLSHNWHVAFWSIHGDPIVNLLIGHTRFTFYERCGDFCLCPWLLKCQSRLVSLNPKVLKSEIVLNFSWEMSNFPWKQNLIFQKN